MNMSNAINLDLRSWAPVILNPIFFYIGSTVISLSRSPPISNTHNLASYLHIFIDNSLPLLNLHLILFPSTHTIYSFQTPTQIHSNSTTPLNFITISHHLSSLSNHVYSSPPPPLAIPLSPCMQCPPSRRLPQAFSQGRCDFSF